MCCNADYRALTVVASKANGKFWIVFIVLYVYNRPHQLETENPELSPILSDAEDVELLLFLNFVY